MNVYKVWVKGRKFETERVVKATIKINALLRLANELGLKTIDCDGILVARNVTQD